MSFLRDFFWFCSGAHHKMLLRCPTESSKFVGIGATVFFTGVLAAISAGYALHTVFDSMYNSVVFAIVWGAMIFNLDRFIVSSMRKGKSFWQELKIALPRLVLAVLLALVISKPLELKIFEKEINRKIDEKKSSEVVKAKEAINKGFPEITDLQSKIAALQAEIKDKETYRNQKQTEYDLERFGKKTGATTGIPGIGRNAKKKEQQLLEADKDLTQTKLRNLTKIDAYEKDIQNYLLKREAEFANQKPTIDRYDGMAARMEALSALAEESSAMALANIFILLLFIAIETSPIFVKLISSKGPYDELLENHEFAFQQYRLEQMDKLEQKTKERMEIAKASSEFSINEIIQKDKAIIKKKHQTETEVSHEQLEDWKETELGKLNGEGVKKRKS